MNIFDDDDDKKDEEIPQAPVRDPAKEAEILTSPAQVILDIRKDIEAYKRGGARKELVEALKDQFIATRHQAAAKSEAVRTLALNVLQARLPEIKSNAELLKVISALSQGSESDFAVLHGAVSGGGALINFQQVISNLGGSGHQLALPAREDGTSNPIRDASHTLEAFEHLIKHIKNSPAVTENARIENARVESARVDGVGIEGTAKENEPDGQDNLIPWRRSGP